jgi:hypothetical protein
MTKFKSSTNKVASRKCRYNVTGRAVAQLVEALRYKPERRGFDYR